MSGSLQLRDYPGDLVRLSCEKCGRKGQYREQTLVDRYGADVRLPDLREEIAQCERNGKSMTLGGHRSEMRQCPLITQSRHVRATSV